MKLKTFISCSSPTRVTAINLLQAVREKLLPHGVEVRVFGSAVRDEGYARDLDVAVVCDQSRWQTVAADLRKGFPNAKIDFGDYTRTEHPPAGDLTLHFVLASERTIQEKPRLGMAFHQGVCLT